MVMFIALWSSRTSNNLQIWVNYDCRRRKLDEREIFWSHKPCFLREKIFCMKISISKCEPESNLAVSDCMGHVAGCQKIDSTRSPTSPSHRVDTVLALPFHLQCGASEVKEFDKKGRYCNMCCVRFFFMCAIVELFTKHTSHSNLMKKCTLHFFSNGRG